jgi:hypothetical protein
MAATAQGSEATASRRQRNDWAAEELASAQTAPFERRADSAAADRQIRNSALAAKSPHLLEALEAERSKLGLPTGYVPQNGPTGEKPHLEAPPAAQVTASSAAAPAVEAVVAPAVEEPPAAPEVLAPVVDLRPGAEAVRPDPVPAEPVRPEPTRRVEPVTEAADAPSRVGGIVPASSPVLPEPASVSVVPMTIPDLLRELASLHRDGILTDDEFQAKKAELLARL